MTLTSLTSSVGTETPLTPHPSPCTIIIQALLEAIPAPEIASRFYHTVMFERKMCSSEELQCHLLLCMSFCCCRNYLSCLADLVRRLIDRGMLQLRTDGLVDAILNVLIRSL